MTRLFLIVGLAVTLIFAVACRDDEPVKPPVPDAWVGDGLPPDTGSNADGGGNAKAVTIFKITDGTEAEGTMVELSDVAVTAIDGYGQYTDDIYVQETKGGPGSALKIYRPQLVSGGKIGDLKLGDRVKVVGKIKYFTPKGGFNDKTHPNKLHIKELESAQVTRLGPGTPPTPVVVTADDLKKDPTAEGYEFVLVQVKDVRVTSGVNSYGEIKVTGGLAIDDDLYPATNKVNECITVTGISLYFFGYKVHSRSAADIVAGSGCPVIKKIKISDIQDTTSADHPKADEVITVPGIITAIDTKFYGGKDTKLKGFWIQEEGTGGPYKGIYVYHQWDSTSSLIPKEGDKIELTGTYSEYSKVSELSYVNWTVTTAGAGAPAPVVVAAADVATGGSKAEEYEGVLVKVSNIKADSYVKTSGGTEIGFKDTTSGLEVNSSLFDFMATATKPATGTTFTSVVGVMDSYSDKFSLLPRKAADLVK
jgi:hypothetical protein